jgi:hypothetical protein
LPPPSEAIAFVIATSVYARLVFHFRSRETV